MVTPTALSRHVLAWLASEQTASLPTQGCVFPLTVTLMNLFQSNDQLDVELWRRNLSAR